MNDRKHADDDLKVPHQRADAAADVPVAPNDDDVLVRDRSGRDPQDPAGDEFRDRDPLYTSDLDPAHAGDRDPHHTEAPADTDAPEHPSRDRQHTIGVEHTSGVEHGVERTSGVEHSSGPGHASGLEYSGGAASGHDPADEDRGPMAAGRAAEDQADPSSAGERDPFRTHDPLTPVSETGRDVQSVPVDDGSPYKDPYARAGDVLVDSEPVHAAPTGLVLFDQDPAQVHSRWRDVQAAFVDDPREAVERADGLLDEIVTAVTATLAARTAELRESWQDKERHDTERLRLALREYRNVLEGLLELSDRKSEVK
ncbi:hypothetical protein [Nonomuraea sp. NPDC046570]|uniref:hypothetical protein n=1 Tax=Nonomuraea sp. NPDC046570 TaxID=3155255 RepID=UPI0033D7C0A4